MKDNKLISNFAWILRSSLLQLENCVDQIKRQTFIKFLCDEGSIVPLSWTSKNHTRTSKNFSTRPIGQVCIRGSFNFPYIMGLIWVKSGWKSGLLLTRYQIWVRTNRIWFYLSYWTNDAKTLMYSPGDFW